MNRDPFEILEKIFEALEKNNAYTMNELSKATGVHYVTIRRYIKLIETVRKEPELEIIKTRHSIILRLKR